MADNSYEKIINHLVSKFKDNQMPSYGLHSVLFFVENDLTHGTTFLQQIAERFEAPVTTLKAHQTFNFIKQMTAIAEHNPKSVIILPDVEQLAMPDQAFLTTLLSHGKVQAYNEANESKTYDFSQCVIIASNDIHAQKDLHVALINRFAFPVTLSSMSMGNENENNEADNKKSASITHIESIRKNALEHNQDNFNKPKN
jgi:hypothetical protein